MKFSFSNTNILGQLRCVSAPLGFPIFRSIEYESTTVHTIHFSNFYTSVLVFVSFRRQPFPPIDFPYRTERRTHPKYSLLVPKFDQKVGVRVCIWAATATTWLDGWPEFTSQLINTAPPPLGSVCQLALSVSASEPCVARVLPWMIT